jgi:hypothetical protein
VQKKELKQQKQTHRGFRPKLINLPKMLKILSRTLLDRQNEQKVQNMEQFLPQTQHRVTLQKLTMQLTMQALRQIEHKNS